MTRKQYWLRIYGLSAKSDLMAMLSRMFEEQLKHQEAVAEGRRNLGSLKYLIRYEDEQGTLRFTADEEGIIKNLLHQLTRELGPDLTVQYPIRVGCEEWTIPHDEEALLVQSTKGFQ